MKQFLRLLAAIFNVFPKTDLVLLHWCHIYGKYGLEAPNLVGMTSAPSVSTDSTPSSITTTSAIFDTNSITNTGGENASVRGICWVTGAGGTPTTANTKSEESGSFTTGNFSRTMSGLSAGTTYSVRAYATNSAGTGYGSTVEVTTSTNPPTVTTSAVSSIGNNTATGNGNVTSDGGATVTERGVVANTTGTPTTSDLKFTAAAGGTGAFTASMTSLGTETHYYVRAYAINSNGTSYGSQVEFDTLEQSPTVSLSSPSDGGSTTDTTPDFTFTGTDPGGDDVRYNIQIAIPNTVTTNLASQTTTQFADSIMGGTASSGELQQARGQSILLNAGFVSRIRVYTYKNGSPTGDWVLALRSGSITGTVLGSVTKALSAVTNNGYTNFDFASPILIPSTGTYYFTITKSPDVLDSSNYGSIGIKNLSSYTDGTYWKRNNNSWSSDSAYDIVFDVYAPTIISKVSGTDSGFAGSPDNSDPYASGQAVTFTLQAGDALTQEVTYPWSVRGIDPSGSNTYGSFPAARTFTVSGKPSVTLVSPSDGAVITDTTPDLVVNGTDPQSDDIRYNIQISALSDNYPTSNFSASEPLYSSQPRRGQTFTGDGKQLHFVEFDLYRQGSPDGTTTAKIYAITGTFGSTSVPTGSALATSTNTINNSSVDNSGYSPYRFYFDNFTPTKGTNYAVVLESTITTGALNWVNMRADNSSPTHPGNTVYYGGSWAADSTKDMCFKLYTVGSPFEISAYTHPSGQDGAAFLSSAYNLQVAQSFAGTDHELISAKFQLSLFTGTPTGNMYAKLYAHSGTFGTSSVPTGTALATSDPVDVGNVPSTYGSTLMTEFIFSTPYQLVSGTNYCIAIEYTGGDGSNAIAIFRRGSSPTHPGNSSTYNGSTWTSDASDLHFGVYSHGGVNVISGTDPGFTGSPDSSDPFASGQDVTYTVGSVNSIEATAATTTTFATSVTSMAVNLPASILAGQKLIASVETRNVTTWTVPTGWVERKAQAGVTSVGELTIFEKLATGSEGATATWTAGTATTAAWHVRKITNWHGESEFVGNTASGDATTADPPSVTAPWGSSEMLAIVVAGHSAFSTTAFSGAPTNYTSFTNTGTSSGGSIATIASAYRVLTASSEDPGTFSVSNNRYWKAATILIRPAKPFELWLGTHFWRAKPVDPSGSGQYGSWSDTRSFTIDEPGTDVSDDRDIESRGSAAASSDRDLEAYGSQQSTADRDFEAHGQALSTSDRSFEVICASEFSSDRDFEAMGSQQSSSDRDFEALGYAIATSTRSFEARGSEQTSQDRSLESRGSEQTDDDIAFESLGLDTASGDRDMEARGTADTQSDRDFEATGSNAANSTITVESRGVDDYQDDAAIESRGSQTTLTVCATASPNITGNNTTSGNGIWLNTDNAKVEDGNFAVGDNHSTNHVKDIAVRLILANGSLGTENKAIATNWDSTLQYVTYGGDGDLWSETLTATDINDSDFGFGLRIGGGVLTTYYLAVSNFGFNLPAGATVLGVKVEVKRRDDQGAGGGGSTLAYVDHIRMTVCYSADNSTIQFQSRGYADVNADRDTEAHGSADLSQDRSIAARGIDDVVDEIDIESRGSSQHSSDIDIEAHGSDSADDDRDFEAHGQQTVEACVLDQSQIVVSGIWEFGLSYSQRLGQSFVPSVTKDLCAVEIKLVRDNEPGQVDNIVVKIYDDNSGEPGTLLGTSTNQVAGSSLPIVADGAQAYQFQFDGVSLTQSETYWWVVSRTGSLDEDVYYYTSISYTNPYPSGHVVYEDDVPSWQSYTGGDFYFREFYKNPDTDRQFEATGYNQASANRTINARGVSDATADRDVEATGSVQITSSRNIESRGTADASNDRDFEAVGKQTTASNRNIEAFAKQSISDDIGFEAAGGSLTITSTRQVQARGVASHSDDTAIEASGSITITDAIGFEVVGGNLRIHGHFNAVIIPKRLMASIGTNAIDATITSKPLMATIKTGGVKAEIVARRISALISQE